MKAGRQFRTAASRASGAYLAWKFGIAPIIQDAVRVHKSLRTLKEEYTRHVQGATLRTVAFYRPEVAFDGSDRVRYSLNGHPASVVYHQYRSITAPIVRYVLITRPKRQYKTELFKKLDFALSRFATSPATLAWELVPFSFMLDWLVDLRGVARAVDDLIGFDPVDIVSFTRSYGYHVSTETYHSYMNSCDGVPLFRRPLARVEYKHYERSLVSTGGSPPRVRPRLGKSQAAITAALIGQFLYGNSDRVPKHER